MSKKFICAMLTFCLLFLLAGCGDGQTGAVKEQGRNRLVYYFGGIISTDGDLRFVPAAGRDYLILAARDGKQYYVLETSSIYDPEQRSEYDEPLQTSCTYRIYGLDGAQLKDITINAVGDPDSVTRFYFPADGDLAKARIMVNQLQTAGQIQVLDVDGNVLLTEQLFTPEELATQEDCYGWLDVGENFMQLRYTYYDADYEPHECAKFYALNGQPLEMPREYNYVYDIYDDNSYKASGYYAGYYENEQGQGMIDILDGSGQLLISGLGEINRYSGGVFVVQRGFERGLMDIKGNWIYQESVFDELED